MAFPGGGLRCDGIRSGVAGRLLYWVQQLAWGTGDFLDAVERTGAGHGVFVVLEAGVLRVALLRLRGSRHGGELAAAIVGPALAASLIATACAWLLLPDQPTYRVPSYPMTPHLLAWSVIAGPVLGIAAALYVRLICWADARKPAGWFMFVAPLAVFAALGAASIRFGSRQHWNRSSTDGLWAKESSERTIHKGVRLRS